MVLKVSHDVQQGMCQGWENQADLGQRQGRDKKWERSNYLYTVIIVSFSDNKLLKVKLAEYVSLNLIFYLIPLRITHDSGEFYNNVAITNVCGNCVWLSGSPQLDLM